MTQWIFDTKVVDHVTCDKTQFIVFYKRKPIKIKFPTNDAFLITKYGDTIKFSEFFLSSLMCYKYLVLLLI